LIRTFKYPLRPTKAQEAVLVTWLGQCCDLYNAALQERRDAWQKQRRTVTLYDQQRGLAEWRRMDALGRGVPSGVQRSALRRIDRAFKAFFRRCKAGQTPGYPRFRSKRRYDSFSVSVDRERDHGIRVIGRCLYLPRLPDIKVHLYRPLQGRILEVTVRREAGGEWVVFFVCDIGAAPGKIEPRAVVGIDVGLKSLAVTSDGDVIENPRHASRAAAKLVRVHRVLRRRNRGSRSWERARIQVARCYAHVRNQRLDHARKTAKAIVDKYDVIAYEDMNIRAMARGLFSKQINEVGWRQLTNAIDCKAESAGKWVVAVPARGTTQRCSCCGETVPKDLSVRVHDCPHCGLRMDRDLNAAINICALGRSAVPWPDALGPTQARSDLCVLPPIDPDALAA
jgi:putative transposase